jgi:hypothetical protein
MPPGGVHPIAYILETATSLKVQIFVFGLDFEQLKDVK